MQRLRPLNDFIFKKLFGETENIDNLKSFLNAVLNKDKTQELVELEIINEKELTTDNIQDKKGIIDVLAKTSDGTNINIEVQLTWIRELYFIGLEFIVEVLLKARIIVI